MAEVLDTTPYWLDSTALPRFPRLERDATFDVVVVGGGITGITAAYLLKQAGRKVALVERGRCAHVDTGHTTAHLTSVTDLRLHELVAKFGEPAARGTWDAGGAAIDEIVRTIRREDIACDFHWVPGYLHAPVEAGDRKAALADLEQERAVAQRLGLAAEWFQAIPSLGQPGIRFAHQAIFHPLKYLAALVRRVPGEGSAVFENSAIEATTDDPLAVQCGPATLRAKDLVLATHTPLAGNTGAARALAFQSRLFLYTSYAVGAKIPRGALATAAFWDTADPYRYLRVEPRRGHDYAILGGEDHKTGQATETKAIFQRLERALVRLVPAAQVDHRWSGQVIATNDGLPFIGETAGHQFVATGFAGNGMTFGTLGAMMAADAVLGRRNPWQELFDVHRTKLLGGTWNYLRENKDYPYYLLRDWLGGTEGKSLRELGRNQGKILQLDGKKVAAHRDGEGRVTLCSPVCTHLQCIVAWNEAEQTWDCPCHGSRFLPGGEVISGPAEEPLARLPAPPA